MFNFAPKFIDDTRKMELNVIHAVGDEVLFVENLRDAQNLAALRMEYNTITYCRSGRIMVEVGGNNQVKVGAGQILMIPTGKLVQPMMISTDVQAGALLVSDRMLKSVLGSQVNIWNKAMYMKEIYVIQEAEWLPNLQAYTNSIFKYGESHPLFHELVLSFLRTLMLFVCEELLQRDEMQSGSDQSSSHDKALFNHFLQLLSEQDHKRQKVSFYADRLHITAKYLSTISKKVSGKTPIRWITDAVMQDCYIMLRESDMTVKEISNRLGFPNSSFFGQYFREEAGVTPVEYRRNHKRIN